MENLEHEIIKFFSTLQFYELGDLIVNDINIKNPNRILRLNCAIKCGLDPNRKFGNNVSLLCYATMKNDIAVVGYLVKHGANVNYCMSDGTNLLHICAQKNQYVLLKFFIEKGVPINARADERKFTPLMSACKKGYVECVDILLKNHADLNIVDFDDNTVFALTLHKIYKMEKNEHKKNLSPDKMYIILQMLIDAKKSIGDKEMKTMIRLIQMNNLKVIRMITDKVPAIVNIPCGKSSHTPLFIAIILHRTEIIEHFMSLKELDVTVIDKAGVSYIHIICSNGTEQLLRDFIKLIPEDIQKKLICSKSRNQKTAIDHVIFETPLQRKPESDIINMITLLVESGVDINSRNKSGRRSIECVVQYYSINVVEAMIDLGAIITEPQKKSMESVIYGNTKFNYPTKYNDLIGFASQLGKLDVVKLLLSRQAVMHTLHYPIKFVMSIKIPRKKSNKKLQFSRQHIPSGILHALINKKYDVALFFLDEIMPDLSEVSKKFLLAIAVKCGCSDQNVLKFFTKKDVQIDEDRAIIYKFNGHINRVMPEYRETMIYTLKNLILFIKIFKMIYFFRHDNDIYQIFDEVDKLYDNIAPDLYMIEILINVVNHMIDFNHGSEFSYCMDIIRDIQMPNKINMETVRAELIKLQKLNFYKKMPQLNKLLFIFNGLLMKAYRDEFGIGNNCINEPETDDCDNCDDKPEIDGDDEPGIDNCINKPDIDNNFYENLTNDMENILNEPKLDKNTLILDTKTIKNTKIYPKSISSEIDHAYIERVLFKQLWPSKMLHYDDMYDRLMCQTYIYQQNSENICILHNKQIIGMIYRLPSSFRIHSDLVGDIRESGDVKFVDQSLNYSKPSKWFQFYGTNIGKQDKCDPNHMFPFVLDKKLHEWPCLEMTKPDPINPKGSIKLCYFYGELLIDGVITTGCFEYFINHRSTLFHRLFRPFNFLPANVRDALQKID